MATETILKGRYRLYAQQGSGGMSVIYKAQDLELQRNVAVKILRPSLTQNPQFLDKFKQEARSVANLSHPNIVTVHDVGNDGPTHFIVMELVEGQDLKKIIQAIGALPVDRVLNLAIQVCGGLGYAHRSGLVHADVKPQNVLVTPQDVVKVTDFGIAQALSDTQPQQRADVVWGSPHYFAPEQARGDRPAPAADVYAIGIMMFELLTGQLPYSGANQQELALAHIQARVPLVTEINPNVPESLARIVHRVMDKDPRRRYQMADQLGNVLRSYRENMRSQTALQGPSTPPPHTPNTRAATPPPQRPATLPQGVSIPNPPQTLPPQTQTERYPLAPNAPQPYDPRAQRASVPSPGNGITRPPEPLQQRYTVQQQQFNTNYNTRYPSQQSQAQPPQQPHSRNFDYITAFLIFLAIVAVAGLVPLFIAVLAASGG